MDCKLLIGTTKRQVHIPGLVQETDKTYSQFINQSQLLNGLPYVVQSGVSGATSKVMEFGYLTNEDINSVKKLFDGTLGDGYMYYADPYAVNILPLSWSVPSNQANAGVGFDAFQSAVTIPTPDNSIGLPANGSHISVGADSFPIVYTFLVDDDKDLAIGIKGLADTITSFRLTWGNYSGEIPISDDLDHIYDLIISRDDPLVQGRVATLSVNLPAGVDRECDLYGLQLSYTNRHATLYSVNLNLTSNFYSGEGLCGGTIVDNIGMTQFEANQYSTHQQLANMTFIANEWSNR